MQFNTLLKQRTKWEGFSREEIALFGQELKSKFWGGVRSPTGFLYIALTFIGVGWASWAIPTLNESETSPETLGIYVIGFLITVMLDSVIAWKKSGVGSEFEQAIAAIFMVISLLLIIGSSIFALKTFSVSSDKVRIGEWKFGSSPLLLVVLIFTILMSLVLTGIDHELLRIGSTDKSIHELQNR